MSKDLNYHEFLYFNTILRKFTSLIENSNPIFLQLIYLDQDQICRSDLLLFCPDYSTSQPDQSQVVASRSTLLYDRMLSNPGAEVRLSA